MEVKENCGLLDYWAARGRNCGLLNYWAARGRNFLPTFRTAYRCHFRGLSCPEMSVKITTIRCVTTQNSAVLRYTH